MMRRIGIYSGTFDPLHTGHISFALAALTDARLDEVHFLPERAPRRKPNAGEYSKRLADIETSILGIDALHVLDLSEQAFTIQSTLPQLRRIFADARLVMLVGADVLAHMSTWTNLHELIMECEFVVGMRTGHQQHEIVDSLADIGVDRDRFTIIQTDHSHVSSTQVRSNR